MTFREILNNIELLQEPGWRSPDQRRTDARFCMLYKITHGIVAIQIPSYFSQPRMATRHSLRHPIVYRQIHTSANYYKYPFFPLNRLPSSIVMLPTLNQFSEAVRSLDHQLP